MRHVGDIGFPVDWGNLPGADHAWSRHLANLEAFYAAQEARLAAAGANPLTVNAEAADAILAAPERAVVSPWVGDGGRAAARKAGLAGAARHRAATRALILAADPDAAGFVPVRGQGRRRGLRWVERAGGKWRARIELDGWRFLQGNFGEAVEAQKAALRAARAFLLTTDEHGKTRI